MGRRRGKGYEERMKLIRSRRRKCWGNDCQFCGTRWMSAKTNFYIDKSQCCQFCMAYLSSVLKKGAAWMLKRDATLSFWRTRLASLVSKKRRKAA